MSGGVEAERVARLGSLNDSWPEDSPRVVSAACESVAGVLPYALISGQLGGPSEAAPRASSPQEAEQKHSGSGGPRT